MSCLFKTFGFRIVVFDNKGKAFGFKKALIWQGYKIEQFNKWRWYFMYRYGLEIVNNPKCEVEYNTFSEDADLRSKREIEIDLIKNKISNSKRKITKAKNSIEEYQKTHSNTLFFEESERYLKTIDYLKSEEFKLRNLEQELLKLRENENPELLSK
ncbi:MAG: hypothetical protein QM642_01940 [Edaphocola sp.]